ncbi:MAG: hypothetical protein ACJAY2_000214 [Pseudomonadales bacterium]|jgi:hypothetical protein
MISLCTVLTRSVFEVDYFGAAIVLEACRIRLTPDHADHR